MPKKLSPRAVALLARLKAGRYYPSSANRTPKAMQELLAAGLITEGGRVTRVELCYVPKNWRPHKEEKFL